MNLNLSQVHDRVRRGQNLPLVGVKMEPDDRLVGQLLERFAQQGWQVIDLNSFNLRLPAQIKFSGALMQALPTDVMAQQMLRLGVPTVRLGRRPHPDDAQMPAIIPDLHASGRLAAEHFAQRGFVHLGFVGYTPWRGLQSLYEGFNERAGELDCHCHLLTLDDEELKARVTADRHIYDVQQQYLQEWWQSLPRPLGLLASHDMAAHRYCQWAIGAGLRVPEDIAILGVGNQALPCEGAIVPISSIDPDDAAMLDVAIAALSQMIAGQTLEQTTIMVPPRAIISRRSTDVLAANDPHVVKALRFMWDHITEDLSVDQIVDHVGVSRRTLEVGFQRDLGRGINTEFQRRRMEMARDLLLQTDWPVAQIARYLGFSSPKYFSKAFIAAYRTSPMKYRSGTTPTP